MDADAFGAAIPFILVSFAIALFTTGWLVRSYFKPDNSIWTVLFGVLAYFVLLLPVTWVQLMLIVAIGIFVMEGPSGFK